MKYLLEYNNIDFEDWDDEEYEYTDPLEDDKFVKFLIDNNIYDRFIYNIKNDKGYLSQNDEHLNRSQYISYTFGWGDSKEGYKFWLGINHKWRNHLKKLNESIDFNDWDDEEYEFCNNTNNKFVRFLKNHGIYDNFIYNCEHDKHYYKGSRWYSLETFCVDLKKYEYINAAFDWENTKEGFDFWEKMDSQWRYLL